MNLFATQITASTTGKGALNGQTLGGNALFGISKNGGLDFLNALLGNIEAPVSGAKNQETANNNLENPNKVKSEKADLALLQLALLGQDPDKSLEEKLGELKIEQLANTKENRIQQLTKLIEHLTSGLPDQAVENGTIEQLVNRLEKRLVKLEASLESLRSGEFDSNDSAFKALIATGLNPAQLTKITDRIQEVENKLGRELTVEDLIAGVGNIIPAPGDEDHEFATTDALTLLINQSQKNNEEKQIELEKKLEEEAIHSEGIPLPFNAVENVGGDKIRIANDKASDRAKDVLTALNAGQIPDTGTQGKNPANLPLGLATEEIAQRLSNGEYQAIFGGSKKGMPSQAKMNLGNAASALTNNAQSTQKVESLLTFNFSDALAAMTTSNTLGYDIQTGAPFNMPMQAATMASNNLLAGQTHPATNLVSAQINKAAQSGNTKNMTLHLDPPELGRVEVRLEFGDERSVKANIIVEKPETLLMLQRDAQALERALQNAGLETDSGSLDFQMAEDGHAFNSDRDGDSRNGGTGSNSKESNDNDDIELIETTMNWDVDPETGHVHYNILA